MSAAEPQRHRHGGRLLNRLVVAVVLAGAVTAAVGGFLIDRSARRGFEAEVRRQDERLVNNLARRFDDRVRQRLTVLDLVATRRELTEMSAGATSELSVVLRTFPDFVRFELYDAAANPVAAVAGAEVVTLADVPARSETDDPERHVGLRRRTQELELSVPVSDPPGTVIGRLFGYMPIADVSGAIRPLRAAPDLDVVVLDRDGRMLVDQSGGPRPDERLDLPDDRVGTILAEDGRHIIAFASSSVAPLRVVLLEPTDEALAPITDASTRLIVILILVISVMVAALTVAGGFFLRNLRPVTQAAERIARGDYETRVPVRDRTEIGTLAFTFNRMVAALRDRIDEIEQRKAKESALRQRVQVAETLHHVGSSLTGQLDLEEVIQAVTDTTTELSGAEFGAFFYNVLDEQGGSYMLYALSGVERAAFESFPMPRNTDIFAPTFAGEQVVRLDDVTADRRYGNNPPYEGMPEGHLPVRSYLAVPVVSRSGETIGGLFFGHQEIGVFDEYDERLVVGIAAQAAVAIDNARLYELEREARASADRRRRRLEILADASRALASSLDLDETIRTATRICVPTVADICVLDLLEVDGESYRRMVTYSDPALADAARELERHPPDPADDDHHVIRAITRGETIVIEGVEPATLDEVRDPEHREAAKTIAPNDVLIVPLIGSTGVQGAMSFGTLERSGRRFLRGDQPLVEELARRAAMAIEAARLFATQRSVAETLQRSLLPDRLPELPGIVTAARYVPGGPHVDVGGDWYDVIELSGGKLALAMGDVVGRGIRAASLMGQLRNALRAYALEGYRPSDVVSRLNRVIGDLGQDLLATLVYAVYEPESGTIRMTNAGHPPPLIVSPGGTTSYFDGARNVPLGAVAGTVYDEAATVLDEGSVLVLYTDGLVEDRDMPLDVGLERLREAVKAGPRELETLCDHLLSQRLGERDVADDIALLALRSDPLGNPLQLELPGRPGVLAPMRATMRRWLLGVGADDREIYEILVAVGEAATNAIEHASGPVASSFSLVASASDEVQIVIRDTGRWRRQRPSLRGRGLDLMKSFMDEVDVIKHDDGTEVRMRRRLRSARSDGALA